MKVSNEDMYKFIKIKDIYQGGYRVCGILLINTIIKTEAIYLFIGTYMYHKYLILININKMSKQ